MNIIIIPSASQASAIARSIAITLAATVMAACSNYLDIKPYGKEIPETVEDFSALMHDLCYNIDIGEQPEIVGNYALTTDFEAMSDNMEPVLETNSSMWYYIGDVLKGSSSGNTKQMVWRQLYEAIRSCNIIIGELKEGRDTREGLDIIGAAYAVRGVCYYQLIRQFCAPPLADDGTLGVPIVTEFDMEAMPARASMAATIAQAESDFRQALDCDPQNALYLFTADAIHGYLARLYHWAGRWQDARDEALIVLSHRPMLDADAFAEMQSQQFGLRGNRIVMGDRISSQNNALSISSTMTALTDRPLSVRYTRLFAEQKQDVRVRNNLYFNRKRKARRTIFSGMRSAEMALIAMEAAYHLGDHATALSELNAFRALRIDNYVALSEATLPPVDTTETVKVDAMGYALTPLSQAILNERRKEMLLENGDRWFELKRNGRPEWWVAVGAQKFWTRRFMYTFPILIADIQLNPAIIQNPGYDETY